ncbi:hypothetical protein ACFORL_00015 [Legionella dresdenensis]|uniref:Ankyrin repeats (3 copies) n=1 Tax=Legionella dresdenensis TaxID=450200 RepID=A0ABV8CBN4_9GAMM
MPNFIPVIKSSFIKKIVTLAQNNDIEGLNQIMSDRVPVNVLRWGYSAVYYLACMGKTRAVYLLLDKFDGSPEQALFGAAEANNQTLIENLSKKYFKNKPPAGPIARGYAMAGNEAGYRIKNLKSNMHIAIDITIGLAKGEHKDKLVNFIKSQPQSMREDLYLAASMGYAMAGNEREFLHFSALAKKAKNSDVDIFLNGLIYAFDFGHYQLVASLLRRLENVAERDRKINCKIIDLVVDKGNIELVERLLVHYDALGIAVQGYNQRNNSKMKERLIRPYVLISSQAVEQQSELAPPKEEKPTESSKLTFDILAREIQDYIRTHKITVMPDTDLSYLIESLQGEMSFANIENYFEKLFVSKNNEKRSPLFYFTRERCIGLFEYLMKKYPWLGSQISAKALNQPAKFVTLSVEMEDKQTCELIRNISPLYTLLSTDNWEFWTKAIDIAEKANEEVMTAPFENMNGLATTYISPMLNLLLRPKGLAYVLQHSRLRRILGTNLNNRAFLHYVLSDSAGVDWLAANPEYLDRIDVTIFAYGNMTDLMLSWPQLKEIISNREAVLNKLPAINRLELLAEMMDLPQPQLNKQENLPSNDAGNYNTQEWMDGLKAIFCEPDQNKLPIEEITNGARKGFVVKLPLNPLMVKIKDGNPSSDPVEVKLSQQLIEKFIIIPFKSYAEKEGIAEVILTDSEVRIYPLTETLKRFTSRQNQNYKILTKELNIACDIIEKPVQHEVFLPISGTLPKEQSFKKCQYSPTIAKVIARIKEELKKENLKIKLAITGSNASNAVEGIEYKEGVDLDLTSTPLPAEILKKLGLEKCPYTVGGKNLFTGTIEGVPVDWLITEDSEQWLTDNANQRDFFKCAFFLDVDGNAYDPTGQGVHDLYTNQLRTIEMPEDSFKNDPSRLVRAIKMNVLGAGFSYRLERAIRGWQRACSNYDEGHIAALSNNLLQRLNPQKFLRKLEEYDLLKKLFDIDYDITNVEAVVEKFKDRVAVMLLKSKINRWLRDEKIDEVEQAWRVFNGLRFNNKHFYLKALCETGALKKLYDLEYQPGTEDKLAVALNDKLEPLIFIRKINGWKANMTPVQYPMRIVKELSQGKEITWIKALQKTGLLKEIYGIDNTDTLEQSEGKFRAIAEDKALQILVAALASQHLEPASFALTVKNALTMFNQERYLGALAKAGVLKRVFNIDYKPGYCKEIADNFSNHVAEVIAAVNQAAKKKTPLMYEFFKLPLTYAEATVKAEKISTLTVAPA